MAELLEENSIDEVEPIDLGLPILKELGDAGWLIEMGTYISQNPQFIVNGFVKAGISTALDEIEESDRTKESIDETEESDGDGTEESDGDGMKKAMEPRQTQPLTWNQNVKIVSQRIVRNF